MSYGGNPYGDALETDASVAAEIQAGSGVPVVDLRDPSVQPSMRQYAGTTPTHQQQIADGLKMASGLLSGDTDAYQSMIEDLVWSLGQPMQPQAPKMDGNGGIPPWLLDQQGGGGNSPATNDPPMQDQLGSWFDSIMRGNQNGSRIV